jgi:outer membrane protein OmpA-like peptidoglycan-associated protein
LATPVCTVDLLVVISNAKTGEILPEAKVAILDTKNNIIATEVSNANGEVNFKIECDTPYSIQATKEGFEGNLFALSKSNGPTVKLQTPLQPIELIITPTAIVLQPIYFDFDKSNITQQGAFELDKLVQVMKSNKNLVIFAKSHTDTRGSDDYNLTLSNRRAQAIVLYLISKGIAAERIIGKGFGENEPIVTCKQCSEVENTKNRRSEFLIVK